MKRYSLLFCMLLMLFAGIVRAQDDTYTPPESVNFRPIEDIVDDEFIVTDFANDGSALLPIITSIPVACTIVYGETEAFGNITLDQNMDGGAHIDHNPILTGLKSETTYYFRVQGTDADGNIYVSDVMTFTTPAFEDFETDNLASPQNGATVVGYSSAFGDAALDDRWGAGSAFDDNPNTEWSSDGDGDDAWVEVELEQRSQIDSVAFYTRSMSDGTAITLAFTVTADDDVVYGPFTVEDATEPYAFDVDFEASVLRFDLVETTGGNTGVVDIVVLGTPVE